MEKSDFQFNMMYKFAFEALLNNSNDMIFIKDINLKYVAVSDSFAHMVGKEKAIDIIGKSDADIFEDKSLVKRYTLDDGKIFDERKNLLEYIEPLADDNGRARYGLTSKYILFDDNGNPMGLLGVTRDITKDYIVRKHYQQELRYLFELPDDTYAVSYIDVDSWRVINQIRQDIKDSTLEECNSVEELSIAAVNAITDKNSKVAKFYENFQPENLYSIFNSGKSRLSFKYQRIMPDGSLRWVYNEARFLIDTDSGHLCVMLTAKDIDAKKKEEQQLVISAKLDKMTMLYNRDTTMGKINQILKDRPDKIHVLYMIDVDNFKSLNDTLGHQVGDSFLVELAGAIKESFGNQDVIGRIGGDEFFAFMSDVSDKFVAESKADELKNNIKKICNRYSDVKLSGSIGISVYPFDGHTLNELYAKADVALYEAKRKGKNRFIFACD